MPKTATLHTNHGEILLNLFENQAPKTVANFVGLASGAQEYADPKPAPKTTGKFYDGLTFHRVIDGFMIQGGARTGTGTGGPATRSATSSIPSWLQPALSARHGERRARARTGRSSSSPSVPTPHLNRRHTIFGEVADQASREVVDKIAKGTDRAERPARRSPW